MKKATSKIEIEKFADSIKHSLTPNKKFPIYDWMCELGIKGTQLNIYAYIFDICKENPLAEHCIETSVLTKKFNVTSGNINYIVGELIKLGLISKRVECKGSKSKIYYSLYQPA